MTPASKPHKAFCGVHFGSVSCTCGALFSDPSNDEGRGKNCMCCGGETVSDATDVVLFDVGHERNRQDERFPNQTLPSLPHGTAVGAREPQVNLKDARAREARAKEWVEYHLKRDALTWQDILEEEVSEAFACTTEQALREELVQVAAVAVRWIEDIDRNGARL